MWCAQVFWVLNCTSYGTRHLFRQLSFTHSVPTHSSSVNAYIHSIMLISRWLHCMRNYIHLNIYLCSFPESFLPRLAAVILLVLQFYSFSWLWLYTSVGAEISTLLSKLEYPQTMFSLWFQFSQSLNIRKLYNNIRKLFLCCLPKARRISFLKMSL